MLLDAGERMFNGVDLNARGFAVTESVGAQKASHYVLRK